VNPEDKKTYPLFGDAAGAVLLAPGDEYQGALAYAVGSDGSGADLLWRPMGGTRMPYCVDAAADGLHYMAMEGRPIFKWAIRMLHETVNQVLEAAGVTIDEVGLVIFHQANLRIIASAVKSLGIQQDQVFNNLDRFGNTSAGSIPLALDEADRQRRIHRGDLVLFSGFGAGLTWGTMLLRW
jgi:3-oxoacyl-[acyl-carrier-protein] synthase-3